MTEALAERLRAELHALAPWHLDVELRDSVRTADVAEVGSPADLGKVSFLDARPSFQAQMRRLFPEGLHGRTLLDCGCNCGGYAFWARELGAGNCFGFDVREHWIKQAEFLAKNRAASSEGIRFAVCDLYDLPEATDESFDISIFKGIFYHLPDPIQGLKIVAEKTKELLILNTATRAGHPDGYLAVSEEPTEALMSGVHGLNWYPTGPEVLRQILRWLGFPATRLSFWHQETAHHGGGGSLGRLELLAARTEATFEHYDRGGAMSAPMPRQEALEPTLSQRLDRVGFRLARRVWWALPRAVRDFVRPILFPSARVSAGRKRFRDRARDGEGARSQDDAPPSLEYGSDGLPVPPYELFAQVIGVRGTAEHFLSSGALAVPIMTEILRRNGFDPREFEKILDWGCGCGRVLRYWNDINGPRVCGSDQNPDLVAWCDRNLPFATVSQNGVAPPLPFPSESFDFVYALSVFTHLTEALQFEWMREIRRILEPGGLFFFTTVGPADMYLERMTEPERKRFSAGELVVRSGMKPDGGPDGSQNYATWHPRSWVEDKMLDGFQLLECEPEGARCNGRQDAWLVQKT